MPKKQKIFIYALDNLSKIDYNINYTFFDENCEDLLNRGVLVHPRKHISPMLWNFKDPMRYIFLDCDCCGSDDMFLVSTRDISNSLLEKLKKIKNYDIINAL